MAEMTNPFKSLESDVDVPTELKEKVMKDVDSLQFITDVTDLLSVKYAETVQTLFKTDAGKEESEKF